MPSKTTHRTAGFTILEVAISIAIIMIGAAIAVPIMTSSVKGFGMKSSTRLIETELQNGRLLAVTTNRAFRLRFNCPAANQFRLVELIGTPAAPEPADAGSDRCSPSRYPYPAADTDPLTLPNKDRPVRALLNGVRFVNVEDIEFWADGTVHANSGGGVAPWPLISPSGVTLSMTNGSNTVTITVNRFGKVQTK